MQIQGSIRGLLRMHGLKMGEIHRNRFDKRVRELLKEMPLLSVAIDTVSFRRQEMPHDQDCTGGQWGLSAGLISSSQTSQVEPVHFSPSTLWQASNGLQVASAPF